MRENSVAKQVVDAAYRVHTTLGPGLLESLYEAALAYELEKRGLNVARQQAVPASNRGNQGGGSCRARTQNAAPGLSEAGRQAPRAAHQLQCPSNQRRHYSHSQRTQRIASLRSLRSLCVFA